MKFHALALCLAGTLAASVAAYAQDNTGNTGNPPGNVGTTTPSNLSTSRSSDMSSKHHGMHHGDMRASDRRGGDMDYTAIDPYTGYSVYAGEHIYNRVIIDPTLPDIRDVAQKVTHITQMQNEEIAELRTLSPKAVTAGYENVHSVYEYMIDDHQQYVNFTDRWLSNNGYPVPPAPDNAAAVADIAPEKSVDRVIQEHEQMMNEALNMRRGEPSSTVRGLLLWAATTAARHITLLRTLDSDIDRGKKTVSARLQLEMSPGTLTAANSDQLFEQAQTEEAQYFATLTPPQPEVVVEAPEQPAPPVAQVPPPAPAPTVQAPAPAPTPAPTVQVPAPTPAPTVTTRTNQSRVAGSRQNTGMYRTRSRRRARRPAY